MARTKEDVRRQKAAASKDFTENRPDRLIQIDPSKTILFVPPPATCTICRFVDKAPSGDADILICRRNPPVPVMTPEGARSMWASVDPNWWCGEHPGRK